MRNSQKSIRNSNAGVWSERLDGRNDLEKYSSACRQADNFLLTPFGVLEKRPGTEYIASTKSDGIAVLWAFQFSTDVGYIIEVGDQYMRFYKDGAFIPDTGDVDSDGDTAEPFEISTPYLQADIREIQSRQINDVVYITHTDYAPRKLIRLTATTFSLSEVVFDLPAMRDVNVSTTTITPSALTGSVTLTASADTFTADNVDGYFRLGQRRKASSVKKLLNDRSSKNTTQAGTSSSLDILGDWEIRTTGRWAGTLRVERYNTTLAAWEIIREFQSNDADRNINTVGREATEAAIRINYSTFSAPTAAGAEDAYAYLEAGDAYVYGYAKVTAYSSATSVTATVIDDFYSTDATEVWEESAWSPRRGYPASCTLYEQRMFYAGNTSEPLKVWGTAIGDFENFLYGVDDSDALSYPLPSTEQNPIEWIAGEKVLVIGNGKEYGILSSGSEDLPLTPTNAIYRPQEAVGFKGVKPELIGDVLVGIERNGRRLREIVYQFDRGRSGGYIAPDLNRLSDDLVESGLLDMDFAQLREPYIYTVTNDGTMPVLHYNRQDNIVGWSKFTTGATGTDKFLSVAIIRGTDNDEVWVTTERTINGSTKRFVERFRPTKWSDAEDQYYVDCGVTYDGASTTTITGLSHLDGQTCKVVADAYVRDDAAPSGGELTLETAASVAHVGLGYDAKWRPMRLDMDATYGNSQGRQKRINAVTVRVYNTRDLQFGVKSESPKDAKFRANTEVAQDPTAPKTGEYDLPFASTFSSSFDANDPDFYLFSDVPLATNIVSTIFFYSIQ